MEYSVECDECGKGVFRRFRVSLNNSNNHDVIYFFNNIKSYSDNVLKNELKSRRGIKWFFCIELLYSKINNEGVLVHSSPFFRSNMSTTTNEFEIDSQIDDAFNKILSSAHSFHREGSNWIFQKIVKFDICVATYHPIQPSSYIDLPLFIKNKKAVINVKNTNDNKCFLWSVLAGLDQRPHPQRNRTNNYLDLIDSINLDSISFPVPLDQITTFENNNSISINVFGVEQKEIYPLRITKMKASSHINLLLIEENQNQHYCYIKNLSRLLSDRTKHNGMQYYCNYCLHGFSAENLLKDHMPYCNIHGNQKTSLPSEQEKVLKFKNFNKQLKRPFIIYADFETFPEPIHTVNPDDSTSFTTNVQQHEPCSFCYIVVSIDPRYYRKPILYRGPNAVKIFLEYIKKEVIWIKSILEKIEPIKLTIDDYKKLMNQTHCHICDAVLNEKYLDHCHVTGECRGYACNICNLSFKFDKYITVVFHNLACFDGNLILNGLDNITENITCVPNTMEKYLSFTIDDIKFIDSYKFLSSSLETLVHNLKMKGLDHFKITKYWTGENNNLLDLMTKKTVYPYTYINNYDKFKEKCLPAKEYFFNDLTEKSVTDEDYLHAQKVWDAFSLTSLGEFHDIYLAYDVLLLADVFELFRKLSLDYYGLDSANYISLPSFSWDSLLKKTKIELELITDIDQYLFIESGIRGGISMVSNRSSTANNMHLNNFDPLKPSKYIVSFDCVNLYGFTQTQYMPTKGFHWLNKEEINAIDIMSIPENSPDGYIFEATLHYPMYLHDDQNDYSLAPEKLNVAFENLSPYSQYLARTLDINITNVKKLIPNLKNKTKYVLHYRNLQLYVALGLEIVEIHRVLGFKQDEWMKPYIDFNAKMRQQAQSRFEQDLFKLIVNSLYGKSLESVRKRINVQLVTTPEKMIKLTSKTSFESFRIFNSNLAAVHLKQTNIKLNKPIFLGINI